LLQLRKISSMLGDEKQRIASAVSQQSESIELPEEQGLWDLYSEGMSYPSG